VVGIDKTLARLNKRPALIFFKTHAVGSRAAVELRPPRFVPAHSEAAASFSTKLPPQHEPAARARALVQEQLKGRF
jgi:hypothetical protein